MYASAPTTEGGRAIAVQTDAPVDPRDCYLIAFREALRRGAPVEPASWAKLYWDDRRAFYEAMTKAWESGRTEPFASLAAIERQAGGLSPKNARRAWMRLLQAGAHAQALAFLLDGRLIGEADADYHEALAQALAGAGHWREAAAEARLALAADPGRQAALTLSETLARLEAGYERQGRTGAWSDTLAVATMCLELGAARQALEAVQAFLRGSHSLSGPALVDLHHVAAAALSVIEGGDVYALFRGLERLYREADLIDDARLAASALLRRPEDPLELARRWRSSFTGLGVAAALAWRSAGLGEAAIVLLGRLTLAHPKNNEVRTVLARCVGEAVLAAHPPRLEGSAGPRKVFDVFPFNDELHMLKIKLGEMSSWVDRFVIVEARRTFTGIEKPLVFQENRQAFAEFLPQIVHVVVEEFPAYADCAWAREFHQRDAGVTGLSGLCGPDDLVMITDTDEIVSHEAIQAFDGDYATLAMERCRYFLNYRETLQRSQQRGLATVWRASYLGRISLSLARAALSQHRKGPRLFDAGWHFTSVADPAGVVRKSQSISHQEHAGVSEDDAKATLDAIRAGARDPGWERCELDGRFPEYVRTHRDELAAFLL